MIDYSNRNDVVDGQIAQYTAFYLNFHGVFLQLYFQTAGQFRFVKNAFAYQYRFGLVIHVMHQRFRHMADIAQSTAGCFLSPFFRIAVTFETDRFGSNDRFFQQTENGFVLADSFFHQFFDRSTEFVQLIGHGGIDGDHGGSTVGRGTCCTEFKTVSCESERRSTVSVCGVQ